MIRLYHGSNVDVTEIDLQRCRRGKDFGRGFYLSDDLAQAEKMAEITVGREECGRPTVMAYEFDETLLSGASELRVMRFFAYTEEWARFVLLNRKNRKDMQAHDFDIVYGPIADDKVGVQIRLFTQELITIDTLVKELSYVRPTFQYFFGTPRAIKMLNRVECRA